MTPSREDSMSITRIGITEPVNGMPVMSRGVVRGDTVPGLRARRSLPA
jgi:hypothetical protein